MSGCAGDLSAVHVLLLRIQSRLTSAYPVTQIGLLAS